MRIGGKLLPLAAAAALVAGCDSQPARRHLTAPTAASFESSASFSDWSTPVSLGPFVNSATTEQQPTVTKDGLRLYFTSGRPIDPDNPAADFNIWVSRRDCTDITLTACAWQEPVALGPTVNTPYLDATPALSRDEHYLFFTSQRARDDCTSPPCNRDLYVSYREDVHDDFAWGPAVNLGSGVNGTGEDLAPAYFENEDGAPQLFFTRGLQAAADLFVSTMQPDGSWGTAAPIAELNLNNIADARPSLTNDGLLMYFWSTRFSGVARIVMSTRDDPSGTWSAPVLVPSPIADAASQQPFIYSHGKQQSLYFIRTTAAGGLDIFVSERTRGGPF